MERAASAGKQSLHCTRPHSELVTETGQRQLDGVTSNCCRCCQRLFVLNKLALLSTLDLTKSLRLYLGRSHINCVCVHGSALFIDGSGLEYCVPELHQNKKDIDQSFCHGCCNSKKYMYTCVHMLSLLCNMTIDPAAVRQQRKKSRV